MWQSRLQTSYASNVNYLNYFLCDLLGNTFDSWRGSFHDTWSWQRSFVCHASKKESKLQNWMRAISTSNIHSMVRFPWFIKLNPLGGCWDMWYGWLHKCSNMCINLNPCRTGRIFRRFSILSNMCKIRKCPFTPCELDTFQNIYFRQHVLMGSYLLSHLSMWCFDQLVNILYPAECEGNPVISANTFEIWFELYPAQWKSGNFCWEANFQ